MAMGNYFFTGPDGKEVKVEYTFGYVKDSAGNLKINLHHSSLPYAPPSKREIVLNAFWGYSAYFRRRVGIKYYVPGTSN